MSRHSREYEALLQAEMGEGSAALAPPQARAYALLKEALPRVGAGSRAPSGWEDRVWAELARQESPRPWARTRWIPAFAAAAAAGLLLVWWPAPEPGPSAPVGAPAASANLSLSIRAGAQTLRGAEASVGDTLHITATGKAPLAVWVYRDDSSLVLRCPSDACSSSGGALQADLPLSAAGQYRVLLVEGVRDLSTPTGDYDKDYSSAISAGGIPRWEFVRVW